MDPFLNGFEYICPKCKKDKQLRAIYTTKRRICVMCGTEITPEEVKRQVNAKLFSLALSKEDFSCPDEWIKINPSSDPFAEWKRMLYQSQEYIKYAKRKSKEAILSPLTDKFIKAQDVYDKKLYVRKFIVGLLLFFVTFILMPWALILSLKGGLCCFSIFILFLILLFFLCSSQIIDYCTISFIHPEIEWEHLAKAKAERELKKKELYDDD